MLFPIYDVFEIILSHYHTIESSHVTLLAFKMIQIEPIKFFQGLANDFNSLDSTFLKNVNEVFTFVLPVVFSLFSLFKMLGIESSPCLVMEE